MTYAMLSMVGNDQTALLDPDTLSRLANKTFSTFFQHYASSNVTRETGGWTWQRINETLPAELGKPGNYGKRDESSTLARRASAGNVANVTITKLVVLLKTSRTAFWISAIILEWLILTAAATALLSCSYIGYFEKRIDTVADVLALVVSSDELLELIKTNDPDDLKRNWSVRTQLGWLITRAKERRYGIEVVSATQEQHGTENIVSATQPGILTQSIGDRSPASPPPSFLTTIQGQRHGYEIVADGDEGIRARGEGNMHSNVDESRLSRSRSGERQARYSYGEGGDDIALLPLNAEPRHCGEEDRASLL